MIPIKLTIEGLYSYQERQVINFTDLTEAGLFGIFGTVGSGKSSILEAISFALYGETERMNSKEKRAYNMMNLKSDKSLIEFEFLNYNNETYKINRAFKRNSKRFDDVKPETPVLYKYKDEEWLPLPHTNVEEILGLSYVNFKRTIIIPQGQFKEFIELGAAERTKMMKEIFGLQRYDLQDKTSVLVGKTKSDLDVLEGKLSGFEEVSEEKIINLKEEYKALKIAESKVKEDFDEVNKNFQQLKALKSDFENLEQKQEAFEILKEQKSAKDRQEQQLIQFEEIHKTFYPLLTELSKINTEINVKSDSIANQTKVLEETKEEIDRLNKDIATIQPLFNDLPNQRKIELDLELIAQILLFSTEIKELKERTTKGESAVKKVLENEIKLQEEIKTIENEIASLSENKIDAVILIAAENWYSKQQNLVESKTKVSQKIIELNNSIASIVQQCSNKNVDVETFENKFAIQFEELQELRKTLEVRKSDLDVQQKLVQYSYQLHDGEACPLCGSLEHPHITETEDVTARLEQIHSDLKLNEDNHKALQIILQEARILKQQKDFIDNQLLQEKNTFEEIEIQINNHKSTFEWEEFDSNNKEIFDSKKKASLDLDRIILEKNNTVKTLREQVEQERINLQKYQSALEKFKIDESQKATQITQNRAQIKVLNLEDFVILTEQEVLKQQHILKATNDKIESDYNALNQRFNALNPQLASQQTAISLLREQLEVSQTNLKILEEQIQSNLVISKLQNIQEVRNIINLKLDVNSIRKELENFKIQFETLKNAINELESKLAKVSFDEETYQKQELRLEAVTQHLKEATEEVIKVFAEIERLEKEFEAKKELIQELSKVEKRSENLKTLANLFKAAGFVQYVSSIYLRQLCDHANIRFHRMTRNQLSLQLNENNDFEIIDYLNEGRSRSVKTLSGGQAFQVSLSLALALAESVQSNAKADKNFFFIDEGFGTQDTDSINIVFETLQSLQKENRIVGIISHVEELKERIPISLQITKDEERGSIIDMI